MPKQGYLGAATLDGDEICVTRINCNETADDLDTTSTCIETTGENSVGYETRLPGVKRMEVNIEGNFDAGGEGDPPAVEVGDSVDLNITVGYGIVGTFLLLGMTYALEVKGLITYSLNFKSNGFYTVGIIAELVG